MTTMKEFAEKYEPATTRNIAELDKVPVNVDVHTFDGEDFSYDYILVEQEKYRVPKTVTAGLQALLKKMPDLQYFSVLKTGTTKNDTRYQVIPME